MSEVLVRPTSTTQMSLPVLWVAVSVLSLEALAGLGGVSVLSYRAITSAGFAHSPGSDALGRTFVIVALLALVGAAAAMATALVRHRVHGGAPSRPLVWAAATVLVTHVLAVLGCLVRAEWSAGTAIGVALVILSGAWARCLRRHR